MPYLTAEMRLPFDISKDRPVLIAGPTASGKSALALEIAEKAGGVIVNADALQVYENWRILSARPSPEDEAAAPHALYGHVPADGEYSVGHWLRDVTPLLNGPERPIIVGGTGLNFMALVEGLANIPATSSDIRTKAEAILGEFGLDRLVRELDADTRDRIDIKNPMRVQRAWEVQTATGRGLASWQDETPPPHLRLSDATALVLNTDKDWLNDRIARRFEAMIKQGALDEARENLPRWNPKHLSSKTIGASELIAHLRGEISLEEAKDAATIATRQFAKRQRTWFRSRMRDWNGLDSEKL